MNEESLPCLIDPAGWTGRLPPSPRYAHGHRWGPWLLDARRLCLCRVRDGVDDPEQNIYEIDLEEVTSPFWLVDWLSQIEGKTWATPEALGHLTRALIQLLRPRNTMRQHTAAQIVPAEVMRDRVIECERRADD